LGLTYYFIREDGRSKRLDEILKDNHSYPINGIIRYECSSKGKEIRDSEYVSTLSNINKENGRKVYKRLRERIGDNIGCEASGLVTRTKEGDIKTVEGEKDIVGGYLYGQINLKLNSRYAAEKVLELCKADKLMLLLNDCLSETNGEEQDYKK